MSNPPPDGMSRPKLIPLSMWAKRRYGKPPSARTLRRWVADAKIFPEPKKEGRAWLVVENACYFDSANPDYSALLSVYESSP